VTENPQDRTMEEYKSLRIEILQLLNRELRLIIFSFTATAAILGVSFTQAGSFQEGSLLFLVPLVILTLLLLQLNDIAHSVVRIASYIRIFLESNGPALNWETRMDKLRGAMRRDPYSLSGELGTLSRIIAGLLTHIPLFGTLFYEISTIVLGFISILLATLFTYHYTASYPVSYADSLLQYVACGVSFVYWTLISTAAHTQLQGIQSRSFETYLERKWKAVKRTE
jgi:hypothetical protein